MRASLGTESWDASARSIVDCLSVMRQLITSRYIHHVVALVTVMAVLTPLVMPMCATAADASAAMPCHPPPPGDFPCHADDAAPDAATLDCCAPIVGELHDEGLVPADRYDAPLFLALPVVLYPDAASRPELPPDIARPEASPPRASVRIPILFRSLLN